MNEEQQKNINNWIQKVWNAGKCRYDLDLHIDELEKNYLLKDKNTLNIAFDFFNEIFLLNEIFNKNLYLILKIPLKNRRLGLTNETTFNLYNEIDDGTPPSFFLINNDHFIRIKNKGKRIHKQDIGNQYQCLFFEYTQEGFPQTVYRHLYVFKEQ